MHSAPGQGMSPPVLPSISPCSKPVVQLNAVLWSSQQAVIQDPGSPHLCTPAIPTAWPQPAHSSHTTAILARRHGKTGPGSGGGDQTRLPGALLLWALCPRASPPVSLQAGTMSGCGHPRAGEQKSHLRFGTKPHRREPPSPCCSQADGADGAQQDFWRAAGVCEHCPTGCSGSIKFILLQLRNRAHSTLYVSVTLIPSFCKSSVKSRLDHGLVLLPPSVSACRRSWLGALR